MDKCKIYVKSVLPCTGELEVANIIMTDNGEKKELQLCVPKSSGISECVGKEIFYEYKDGSVRLTDIKTTKSKDRASKQKDGAGD